MFSSYLFFQYFPEKKLQRLSNWVQSISAPAKSGAPLQARSGSISGAPLRVALRPRIRSAAPASAPALERCAPTALRQNFFICIMQWVGDQGFPRFRPHPSRDPLRVYPPLKTVVKTPIPISEMLGQDISCRVSTLALPSQNPGWENPISTINLKLKLWLPMQCWKKYLVFRSVLNSRAAREIFHIFFHFLHELYGYRSAGALVALRLALRPFSERRSG